LNSVYLQRMTKTAYDIPNTAVGTEFGQFNSNVFDVKLGVSQSIKFPVVYKKQKQLLVEEAKQGQWNEAIQKRELTKQVTQVFYEMIYLKEKEKLLQKTDTIYSEFLRKSTLRFDKGESNVLEKATAENLLGQIKIQLAELQNDYKALQTQFKYLLNSNAYYLLMVDKYKIDFAETIDTNFVAALPNIKIIEQEKSINIAKMVVEKTKKNPELVGSAYYQTFRTNSTFQNGYNGLYGSLGIAIPLFNTSIKNKIKALAVNNEIADNKLLIEKQNQLNIYQQGLQDYHKYKATVAYYENEALKNVDLVLAIANKKFINGEINYLEWVMLINQNTQIQSSYIEAVRLLNNSIINLNTQTTF
jgi:heavy metal efflux system protein